MQAQALALHDHVAAGSPDLMDLAWSLAFTRTVFEHRAVIVGADRDELLSGLRAVADGTAGGSAAKGALALLFTGQVRSGWAWAWACMSRSRFMRRRSTRCALSWTCCWAARCGTRSRPGTVWTRPV
ncbi:hypothetical protein ACFQZ4_03525 [Catellatospora coxensis]